MESIRKCERNSFSSINHVINGYDHEFNIYRTNGHNSSKFYWWMSHINRTPINIESIDRSGEECFNLMAWRLGIHRKTCTFVCCGWFQLMAKLWKFLRCCSSIEWNNSHFSSDICARMCVWYVCSSNEITTKWQRQDGTIFFNLSRLSDLQVPQQCFED